MYVPNPILLAGAGVVVLPITAERGGLAGSILLGPLGPPVTVEVSADGTSWRTVTYPHTLAPGEQVRLSRTDPSTTASTIRMLSVPDEEAPPVPEAPPVTGTLTVEMDTDGYQAITNAEAVTDEGGYQTIQDATPVPDNDGYETVERST